MIKAWKAYHTKALRTLLLRPALVACLAAGMAQLPMSFAAVATAPPSSYSVTNLTDVIDVPPQGINAAGHVAGIAVSPDTNQVYVFLYAGTAIRNLGTPGSPIISVTGINESDQISGYFSVMGSQDIHAFIYNGSMRDLGTLGGRYSYAYGINTSGTVVGYSEVSNSFGNVTHAVKRKSTGEPIDLGTLGGNYSAGYAINDAGATAGTSYYGLDSSLPPVAFYHDGATMQSLTAGSCCDLSTFANAINASGQIVGSLDNRRLQRRTSHAFVWSPEVGLKNLHPEGMQGSIAFANNDLGQVLGIMYSGNIYRSFIWEPVGQLQDIGDLGGGVTQANAINNSGQIVGFSYTANQQLRAFIWSKDQGMVDLNTRLSNPPAGLELYHAIAISDNGAIVASSNAGLVLLGGSSTAPVVGSISANDPVLIESLLTVNASFTDIDLGDTHSAQWTWGDGSAVQAGIVSEANGKGSVTGSHSYAAAGIYKVTLRVTDTTGHSATVSRDVVVYDPAGGFVTGGGWMMSPPGAYRKDAMMAGRASFSFVSKYQKGAINPTGKTEFQFQTANLHFHSDNYDWLVISGARAQYKGTGTINGTGSYKFMLTAVDGDLLGKDKEDRFRIKISHYDADAKADVVVYDNQLDSSTEGGTSEGTVISSGTIVIHK